MAYGCLGTDSKYIVTCRMFIFQRVMSRQKKITVHHVSSPSRKSVLIQELVLDHMLAGVVRIAVIKLFYVEAQHKRLYRSSITMGINFTYLFVLDALILIGGL